MPATEVKVNLDALSEVLSVYVTEVENIREAYASLKNAMERLRDSGWKANSADEFFKNYDSSWKVDMENHIIYLEHLKGCLEKACQTFSDVYQKNIGGY